MASRGFGFDPSNLPHGINKYSFEDFCAAIDCMNDVSFEVRDVFNLINGGKPIDAVALYAAVVQSDPTVTMKVVEQTIQCCDIDGDGFVGIEDWNEIHMFAQSK